MVNNAGIEFRNPFLDVPEEQFDRVVGVDLKGAFFCAQAAAREMVKRKTPGRIINISSVHEDLPMPKNAPYCCAKGGLRMMARTISLGTRSLPYHCQQYRSWRDIYAHQCRD